MNEQNITMDESTPIRRTAGKSYMAAQVALMAALTLPAQQHTFGNIGRSALEPGFGYAKTARNKSNNKRLAMDRAADKRRKKAKQAARRMKR